MNWIKCIKQGFLLTVSMLVLCGLIYPFAVTGVGKLLFPAQAAGSVVSYNGQAVGAHFVGQEFHKDYYLWSRPSAVGYNIYVEKDGKQLTLDGEEFGGVATGSANYAASNPDLAKRVKEDMAKFLKANPSVKESDIPADLMTASGSGLDPQISPKSAEIQIPRIAKASGLSADTIKSIIAANTTGKLFGLFGGAGVNVLGVNIDITKAMAQK